MENVRHFGGGNKYYIQLVKMVPSFSSSSSVGVTFAISALGAAGAAVYAGVKLYNVDKELKKQETKLKDLFAEKEKTIQAQVDSVKAQVDSVKAQTEFVKLQALSTEKSIAAQADAVKWLSAAPVGAAAVAGGVVAFFVAKLAK